MPLDETTEAELLAYAYGELPAPAARAFEQRLQGDAALQAELAGIMATRELFGRDLRWGLDTKVDAPPPHLLDAIVRAEVLARPPAIRDARALTPRPTLTARLSRWLIGGGVLVGAAAALLVVVKQGDRAAEAMAPATPLGVASAVEEAPPPPPAPPPAEVMAAGDLAKDEASDALDDNEAGEARLRTAARGPLPDSYRPLARADGKPKPTDADGDRSATRELAKADRDGAALGLIAPAGGAAAPGKTGSTSLFGGTAPSAAAPPPEPESSVAKKVQSSLGGADDGLAFDTAGASSSTESVASPASLSPPTATPAPVSSSSPRHSAAPMAPPSDAPALTERPSTGSLDVLSPAEAKAERRRMTDARAEERSKRKKPAAKGEKAAEQERAAPGAKNDAKKSADKASPVQPGPEQKRAMQSELALMSGYRELKEGRALAALDEFQNAERFDARRALGSDPHVGQMRSLLALKRPAEALVLARRLVTRDLAEVGVADGLLLGAKIAEELGDLRSARELWTTLLKAPAHKVAAQQALTRLANPPVRAQLETDAAAEPASKE